MSRIIILSAQRSGSTLLGSMLSNHPQISYYGEVLKNRGEELKASYSYINFKEKNWFNRFIYHRISKNTIAKKYWEYIFSLKKDGQKNVGCKVMINQLSRSPELYNFPEDVFIIRLKRENLLSRHVSSEVARRDKEWTSNASKGDKKEPITLDCSMLLAELDKRNAENKEIETLFPNNKSYSVTYEESVKDPNKHIAEILTQNGLEVFELKSVLKKQIQASLNEIIENYTEVEKLLKGTKYESFLNA